MKIGNIEIEVRAVGSLPKGTAMLVAPGAWERRTDIFPDGHREVRDRFRPERVVVIQNIGPGVGP